MPRTPVVQVRNWIGTLNGIDASFDAEGYLRTMVERGLAKYAVGQLERGSESREGSISSTSYRWSVLDD